MSSIEAPFASLAFIATSRQRMSKPQTSNLSEALGLAFNDQKYSDLLIRCNGSTFHVHKVVVCSQSKFFRLACDVEMQEKQSGVIDLEELDETAVKAVLMSFYGKTYDIPGQSEQAFNDDYEELLRKPLGQTNQITPARYNQFSESFYERLMFHIKVNAVAVQLNASAVVLQSALRAAWDFLRSCPCPSREGMTKAVKLAWETIPEDLPDFPEARVMQDVLVEFARYFVGRDYQHKSSGRPVMRRLMMKQGSFRSRFAVNQCSAPLFYQRNLWTCPKGDLECSAELNDPKRLERFDELLETTPENELFKCPRHKLNTWPNQARGSNDTFWQKYRRQVGNGFNLDEDFGLNWEQEIQL
ncbi:MAG: hypothetical protein M1828_004044 [Chrysothrix sp. TS-e1954]|nr:MAG: hypothetical protein M1828_004044 [Chrysothrix sp. TS-e1954]